MKQCGKCKKEKSLCEFATKKGKAQSWCKRCTKERSDAHYRANRSKVKARSKTRSVRIRKETQEWLLQYFERNPCSCGQGDPILLDFDHRDPESKDDEIASMMRRGLPLERIKEEIEKCDVLCVVCHRYKTAKEGKWWRIFI